MAWLVIAVTLSTGGGVPVLRGPTPLLAALKKSHRPTIVHFWATWCGACLAELPEIQRLTKEAAAVGVDVAFVSLDDPKDPAKVSKYLTENGLLGPKNTWAVLLDAKDPAPIAKRFDPRWQGELPATFFSLESGDVVTAHLGPTPVDILMHEVKAFLASPKAEH